MTAPRPDEPRTPVPEPDPTRPDEPGREPHEPYEPQPHEPDVNIVALPPDAPTRGIPVDNPETGPRHG